MSDPISQQHLTDDDFAACLDGGQPSPVAEAHLAACEPCREELSVFLISMESFSNAALDWSAAQPVAHPRTRQYAFGRLAQMPQLRWAAAAAFAFILAAPIALHYKQAVITREETAAAAPTDSAAQIAQDNVLLQQVNIALADNDPSPIREYGLAADLASQSHTGHHRVESRTP